MTGTAQIVKTYTDGTFEIVTMPTETARAHVAARTANADHYGIIRIAVNVEGRSLTWDAVKGWTKACDNAATEHPGFPCSHPC
jgi:hypothetical protein